MDEEIAFWSCFFAPVPRASFDRDYMMAVSQLLVAMQVVLSLELFEFSSRT